MLTAMPIYHIAGMLWGLTAPVLAGCTMVIMSRFDPSAMAAAITNLKVTKLYGTVSMNTEMMALPNIADYDLSSVRINPATSFGIFLTEEVARRWGEITKGGVIVEAAYGLSETHTGDTFSPLDKPRFGSVGIPHTGTDLKDHGLRRPGARAASRRGGRDHGQEPGGVQGLLGPARRPPPRCCATAVSIPATWAASMKTATCTSWDAKRR